MCDAQTVAEAQQEREQLRADLAAAVAARDWQIQATKAAIESCNQATTAGLAAVAERDQLRARLAAIEAAPVVARPKFIRDEICGCRTRPTHYVGEVDCPRHKKGDGQPKDTQSESEAWLARYTTPPPAQPTPWMFTAEEMKLAYQEGWSDFSHGQGIVGIDWRNSITFKETKERTK